WTRSSISLHSFDTCDLLMPDSPIACTRSSTRRGDTPPIQASLITATSAFSELLRASRNGGEKLPPPQFGVPRWSEPSPGSRGGPREALRPGVPPPPRSVPPAPLQPSAAAPT